MMDNNYVMTWDETFRAVRCGDIGVIVALTIECMIMASPLLILFGVWAYTP